MNEVGENMRLETLMANILIHARTQAKENYNSTTDKKKAKVFAEGWEAALMQVQLDLGVAFGRMKPEAKLMELMDEGPTQLPIVKDRKILEESTEGRTSLRG
jgi:hypothetical protein